MLENQSLIVRADDSRDWDLIRELRRELDENKWRQSDLIAESNEMRREWDNAWTEISDLKVDHARELESEVMKWREAEGEIEKLWFKL